MIKFKKIILLSLLFIIVSTAHKTLAAPDKKLKAANDKVRYEVLAYSDVKWEQLNPARGDQSPKSGTLWGDRVGLKPCGFLLKPVDGFRSPPHIHNIAYRGVVINDLLHNDDPGAADLWMPAGSFWTQPAGEVHITAAKGKHALAYIEVEGAFGVLPATKAFKTKEYAVNVHTSNIMWLDFPGQNGGVKIAYLWGKPQKDGKLSGSLIQLPAGFNGKIINAGSTLRSVLIQGELRYSNAELSDRKLLAPGSYFSSTGKSEHQVTCEKVTVLYMRTTGTFSLAP